MEGIVFRFLNDLCKKVSIRIQMICSKICDIKHGSVRMSGVLVQLMVDGEKDKAGEMKDFLQKLGIRTTLAEMGAPTGREALSAVLKETVTGPDMEHIPYEVTEDMIYEAMCQVEAL